jgi:hypothetical protein
LKFVERENRLNCLHVIIHNISFLPFVGTAVFGNYSRTLCGCQLESIGTNSGVVLQKVEYMKAFNKRFLGVCMVFFGALLVFGAVTSIASAQTDMSTTLTSLNGYWTTAEALGIGILLFVIGRRVIKKI